MQKDVDVLALAACAFPDPQGCHLATISAGELSDEVEQLSDEGRAVIGRHACLSVVHSPVALKNVASGKREGSRVEQAMDLHIAKAIAGAVCTVPCATPRASTRPLRRRGMPTQTITIVRKNRAISANARVIRRAPAFAKARTKSGSAHKGEVSSLAKPRG